MNKLQGFEDAPVSGGVKTITAEEVLKIITAHTFGCVVAGGFARDKHFGVQPKDIDVCVYNFHPEDIFEVILLNGLWECLVPHGVINLSRRLASQGNEIKVEYEVNDSRVYMVWNLPSINMDLIFYNKCGTWWDVVSRFDFNLNQFYLPSTVNDEHFDGEEIYAPDLSEAPVYAGSHPIELLVQLKDNLTDERIQKMLVKHMQLLPKSWEGDKLAYRSHHFIEQPKITSSTPFD